MPEIIETGDTASALVEAHRDYARALAMQIAGRLPDRVDREELVQFGVLGLVEAARRYDPALGAAFTTFAYYRIRGAVFDGLRKMTWLPPAARRRVDALSGGDELVEDGVGELGAEATLAAAAALFGRAVRQLGAVHLLGDLASADGEDADALTPTDATSAAAAAGEGELLGRLRSALEALPEDLAAVVRMHYFEHRSMTDCARELGVHKATVSRAHGRAIGLLADALAPRTGG